MIDPRARIRIRERERARSLNGAVNIEEKRENREMGWTRRERKDSKRPGSLPDRSLTNSMNYIRKANPH